MQWTTDETPDRYTVHPVASTEPAHAFESKWAALAFETALNQADAGTDAADRAKAAGDVIGAMRYATDEAQNILAALEAATKGRA